MARYNPKKIRNAYARSTLSITLVMFLMALITFILYNVCRAASNAIDSTSISVMLKDDITETQREGIKEYLSSNKVVSEVKYISKEDALEEFKEFTGEDASKFITENPLPASFTVKLVNYIENYKEEDATGVLAEELTQKTGVTEVLYQKEILAKIVKNVRMIYSVSAIFFVVLIVISLMLIHNTINMAVYSKRFLIKTMCMAGATEYFVRKPFLALAVKQAFVAAFVTCLMLTGVIYLFLDFDFMSIDEKEIKTIMILYGGVFIMAIFSCVTLTQIAVNKNMNLTINRLHNY